MPINDLYMLTHKQRHIATGESILSNYFYNGIDIGSNAEELYNEWTEAGGMLELVNEIQCDTLENDTVRVVNLFSLTDFFEDDPTGGGTRSGEQQLPLHTAVNFSLKLDTRGIRPGSKRISGIPESAQDNGLITLAGYITDLEALRLALVADVGVGGVNGYDPVVVKRIFVPATEDTAAHYRLPLNSGEADYGHVIASVVNLRLSHQVSRGNGR